MTTVPYRAPMTALQMQFFQALCQPFHPADIRDLQKSGRTLSWIQSYAMMNRLDEVAGPHGWTVEYTPTERGQKCRLGILVPVGEDSDTGIPTFEWRYREDGGGDAGMQCEEDDEKSGYTDAFKRACMAWGINRPLWGSGAPDWMQGVPVAEMPYRDDNARPRPSQQSQRHSVPPAQQNQPRQQAPPQQSGGGQYNDFAIPKAGKAVYAWAKKMEQHYGQTVIPGLRKYADGAGWGTDICALEQHQVNEMVKAVIEYFKTLDSYRGEWDTVEAPASPNAPPPGMNALRGKVWEAAGRIADLISEGDNPPSDQDKMHVVKTAWSQVNPNGQVLLSLKGCEDFDTLKATLDHMEKYEQAKRANLAVPVGAEIDDDIPF